VWDTWPASSKANGAKCKSSKKTTVKNPPSPSNPSRSKECGGHHPPFLSSFFPARLRPQSHLMHAVVDLLALGEQLAELLRQRLPFGFVRLEPRALVDRMIPVLGPNAVRVARARRPAQHLF